MCVITVSPGLVDINMEAFFEGAAYFSSNYTIMDLYTKFYLMVILSMSSFCVNVFTKPITNPRRAVDFPTTSFLTNKPIQKRQLDGGGPASALTQIPSQLQNFGQLQQGFSTLMNTMKDGKMVMGGFSFVIVPAPDMEQLQGLPTLGGLPSIPSLPGAGGS
ncbi:uncharacterized protein isoform X1 [Rhodnius prolixus]|uniref:uncharacterized protein isoform X1 n=1 Tax=Rhodnius prolixus TaxID=13249 RepID=UPI003D18A6AD